jgi:hypothetical protein
VVEVERVSGIQFDYEAARRNRAAAAENLAEEYRKVYELCERTLIDLAEAKQEIRRLRAEVRKLREEQGRGDGS